MLTVTRKTVAPTIGASAFAKHIAHLTGTSAELWEAPGSEGDRAQQRRLTRAANAVLDLNPASADLGAEHLDMDEAFDALEAEFSASARLDQIGRELAEQAARAELEDQLDAWTPSELAGVERWSPFRGGPRWICKSGRHGDGTPAARH